MLNNNFHSMLFVFLCVYCNIFNPGGRGVGKGGKDRGRGGGYRFVHADVRCMHVPVSTLLLAKRTQLMTILLATAMAFPRVHIHQRKPVY